MALTLAGLEIEKTSGYWRMYDPETGKLTTKAGTLWGLLKKIH